jgi:citrate synthase
MVHEHLIRFFNGFNHDAHPMAIMVSVVGALSAFYDDKHMTYENAEQRYITGVRVFAKMATIAAMAYKVRSIQTFFTHRPVSTLDRVFFQLTGEPFLYGTTLRGWRRRYGGRGGRRGCGRRCTRTWGRGGARWR